MIAECRELKRNGFVFTINGKSPISDGTMNKALRLMGYDRTKHVPHGFRKSFSTITHEAGHDSDVIELCLAHADKNKIREIYNKAERMDDRREVMEAWGGDLRQHSTQLRQRQDAATRPP